MTTQRHEIEAWLGDFADELTDDQINDLVRISDEIEARYPDPDDEDERRAAMTVAHRLMVEDHDDVVDELAQRLRAARLAQIEALAGIRQAALILVQDHPRGRPDAPEVTTASGFARRAGVDRSAVIGWRESEGK